MKGKSIKRQLKKAQEKKRLLEELNKAVMGINLKDYKITPSFKIQQTK